MAVVGESEGVDDGVELDNGEGEDGGAEDVGDVIYLAEGLEHERLFLRARLLRRAQEIARQAEGDCDEREEGGKEEGSREEGEEGPDVEHLR